MDEVLILRQYYQALERRNFIAATLKDADKLPAGAAPLRDRIELRTFLLYLDVEISRLETTLSPAHRKLIIQVQLMDVR